MKKLIAILVACLLLATFKSQALAQEKDLENVFAPVKKELRTRLIERLQLLTEYDRTYQWDKAYDLLFGHIVEGRTREEYVIWQREVLGHYENWFMDFTPESVDQESNELYPHADYRITGTVKLNDHAGSKWTTKRYVYAQLRDGEWYFSG